MHTRIAEVGDDTYQLTTYLADMDFAVNQYLVAAEEPLLFHTGMRGLFPLVAEAVEQVLPIASVRWIGFGHVEADECGSLNDWLGVAPRAVPVCGRIGAMTTINDVADRPPRVLAHAETLTLGQRTVRWLDTPHVPHAWDCGLMLETTTRTFLCGDLFTQGGTGEIPLTESDILEPSEEFRAPLDYFAHSPDTTRILERIARERPTTLACMHGSAFRGDGAALLLALAERVAAR